MTYFINEPNKAILRKVHKQLAQMLTFVETIFYYVTCASPMG